MGVLQRTAVDVGPYKSLEKPYFLAASSTATAQATVIPTMGLLPAPIRPIISTHSEAVDKTIFQNTARKPCYDLLFNTIKL